MIKLKCLSQYRNDRLNVNYQPGDVFELEDDELAAFLRRDSPGSFRVIKPRAKRVRKPAAHKMVVEPEAEK